MPIKEITRVSLEDPDFESLAAASDEFTKPILVENCKAIGQLANRWNLDYFREKASNLTNELAPLHTASYWAKHPIKKEFYSRAQSVNFEVFFEENNVYPVGSYYISHLKYDEGKYISSRVTDLNQFEKLILDDLPPFKFANQSVQTLIWLSRGGTKSNLHADPLHNFFMQITGEKKVFLIAESQKKRHLHLPGRPYLLRINDPFSAEAAEDKEFQKLDTYQFVLKPGDGLLMPYWIFHHIEAVPGLNASITHHFSPGAADKMFSIDYWRARINRKLLPKLLYKKRIHHYLSTINSHSVPFFEKKVQFLKQAAINPNWVTDATHYIISQKTGDVTPIISSFEVNILNLIDGRKTIGEIATLLSKPEDKVISSLNIFISKGLIACYSENVEDSLNLSNKTVEF